MFEMMVASALCVIALELSLIRRAIERLNAKNDEEKHREVISDA
jgi:hypothetical protein